MPITILLADDNASYRGALRALLETDPRVRVVGEAADGEDAVRLAGELAPDVVLMDLSMPGIGGIEATRRIAALGTATHVIGLSLHDDAEHEQALRAAGGRCLVSKGGDTEAIWAAILAWAGSAERRGGVPRPARGDDHG